MLGQRKQLLFCKCCIFGENEKVAKTDKLSAVKGMNDILPGESARWEWLEAQVRDLMGRFAVSRTTSRPKDVPS